MKRIPGFSKYQITKNGEVFNDFKKLRYFVGKNDYRFIKLVDDYGKTRHQSIHRLVAKTYIPNPNNKATVNHIDGNRANNNINNLEWLSQQENLLKGYERRNDTPMKFHKTCDLYYDEELVKSFSNIKEASYYAQEKYGVKATMLRKWKQNGKCQIKYNDYPIGE